MQTKVPCFGCNKRELACHSYCSDWARFRTSYEAEKAMDKPGAEYAAYKKAHLRDLAKKYKWKRGNRTV